MNRRPSISFAVKTALAVCAAGVAFHGATKNGGGKLNAKVVGRVALNAPLSRPHGDEASSLVAATAPTFADRKIHQWNTCGAWKYSDATIDFADGFVFPWGTNRLARINVVSQGRLQPSRRDTNAIANVGVALSMVPGVSRFAYEHTPSNTYRFAWSDAVVGRVALNAPQYETLDASIELFRNGDSVITTNGFARQVKYVNPYDLDGDGLANWLDSNPTVSDGDCFGTGVDWLNLNCGGVLSATTNAQGEVAITWNDGAKSDAYYWLTFSSRADNNRITATCDGESNLGNLEIIAKEGQVCRIPLLIGAKYVIESTDGIGDVSANDADAKVYELASGLKYEVRLPLEISFVRVGAAVQAQAARRRVAKAGAASSSSGVEWKLTVLPRDPGVEISAVTGGCCNMSLFEVILKWECEDDCTCGNGEHPLGVTFAWEGYEHTAEYLLTCACAAPEEEDEPRIGDPQLWLSMPSVLYTNGDGTANPSDLAPLSIGLASATPTNGMLWLESTTKDIAVALWADSNKTTRVNFPIAFDVDRAASTNFFVEALAVSGARNANGFRVAWLGSDLSVLKTAQKDYTVYCPKVDVVNNNMTTLDGTLYNPAGIVVGTNAHFAVDFSGLAPPESDIHWSIAAGSARFVGGNTGFTVRVASDAPNQDVRLRVRVGDCVSPPMEFLAHVVEPLQVKLSVWIVRDDNGDNAARTPDEVQEIVEDVNRLYRQIGVSFCVDSINFLDSRELLRINNAADDGCNWDKHLRLVNTAKNTGGLEIYFIDNIFEGRLAQNDKRRGIVVSANATSTDVAHELGHSFGCADIYPATAAKPHMPLPDSTVRRAHAPQDWSNGDGCRYYEHSLTQEELIRRLLMCGFSGSMQWDMSYGSIYGYSRFGNDAGLVDMGFFVNGARRNVIYHQ